MPPSKCLLRRAGWIRQATQGSTKVPSSRPGQVDFEVGQVTFQGHPMDNLPAYRPHFFQGKKRSKFGVRLIRGYKSSELINMQIFPTHPELTKLLKAWQLNECIVWGQVNPCLRRILLLSAAMSVSSSEYVCYWKKSKEVCMSSHEALSMPFTWNCVCLFAELHEKYTEPVTKRKIHK